MVIRDWGVGKPSSVLPGSTSKVRPSRGQGETIARTRGGASERTCSGWRRSHSEGTVPAARARRGRGEGGRRRAVRRAIATGVAPGYNGEDGDAYCEAFSASLGGGYTDAVSSGTAGVYVALRALDLEPFGEVIVGAVTDPGGMMPIPLLNQIPMVADTAPGQLQHGPGAGGGADLAAYEGHRRAAHRR